MERCKFDMLINPMFYFLKARLRVLVLFDSETIYTNSNAKTQSSKKVQMSPSWFAVHYKLSKNASSAVLSWLDNAS